MQIKYWILIKAAVLKSKKAEICHIDYILLCQLYHLSYTLMRDQGLLHLCMVSVNLLCIINYRTVFLRWNKISAYAYAEKS